MPRIGERLSRLILGTHPHNTRFSFNFHNIRHVRSFIEQAGVRIGPVPVVADVGGGACPYFGFIQSERWLAVDPANGIPEGDRRGVEYVEGTAEAIPLPDGSVDVVLLNQVLEHVVDVDRTLAEVRRVLRPGGWLVGSVPHISPVHLEPLDFRRFTDLGLRQALADFDVIDVDGSGGAWEASALLITMDWVLSRRVVGRGQVFSTRRALLMSPLVWLVNTVAQVADRLRDTGRSPANLCWLARKH